MKIILALCLLISVFELTYSQDDEFYCYKDQEEGKFEFCQTCKSKEWDPYCAQSNQCKCANLRVAVDGKLKGGVKDCNTEGWCYVTENSGCETLPNDFGDYYPDYYHDYEAAEGLLYRSSEACMKTQDNVGNEAELENVKITSDALEIISKDGQKIDESIFFMETFEDCKKQCESSNCGAWSYDKENLECQLHNVNACCGQFGKREINKNFVSGYVCHVCSSTKKGTDCPCSPKERQRGAGTENSIGGGAVSPLHQTAAGVLFVSIVNTPADPCACRRGKLRDKCNCWKPRCKDDVVNPNGTCDDIARCRNFGRTLDELFKPEGC